MYDMTQSPIALGGLQIANRVVMPAMGVNLAACGGGVTDDVIAYYEARARGGVGLIISEVTRVIDGAGASEPCQLAARGLGDVPDLQRLVDAIHKYDTKLFIQLQHPGSMAAPLVTGARSVVPSYFTDTLKETADELSTGECEALVQAFVTGAVVAQMAGADGVELHGAHGYLLNQFLSPAMNFRADRYGGSFEGRMRFVVEIVQGIKKHCGMGFPISVRINAEESLPGGAGIAEAQDIVLALQAAGADAINVSCMTGGCIEPGTYEQGWKKHRVAAIRSVIQIPVIAVCNIKDPDTAENLLNEGICDLVGVGRGHLADPAWCRKAFMGQAVKIRSCIGCLTCFDEICKLHRIKCAVNPATGREREYAHPVENGDGRTVAIVGGGPAGIEAALVLGARGFSPVVFEESVRLGGTLNIADKGFGKTFTTKYVDSLIAQVDQAGIEVRTEKATVENVRALNACGVFLASGAVPYIPSVKGIDGGHVCTAEDVLRGKVKPQGKVVIVGAGMTGLEASETLACDCGSLSIVEMLDRVGAGIYPAVVEDIMGRIEPHGAQVLCGHRLEEITQDAVILTRLADDGEVVVEADWVVLSLGVRPRHALVDEFRSAFADVQVIGDARAGGRIIEATQDAHAKAFIFEPRESERQ